MVQRTLLVSNSPFWAPKFGCGSCLFIGNCHRAIFPQILLPSECLRFRICRTLYEQIVSLNKTVIVMTGSISSDAY